VPAPVRAAPAVLAHANPPALTPRHEGARDPALTATDGGSAHRWRRSDAAPRQAQARRPVDTPWRQPRAHERHAVQPCCGAPVAGDAEARQALVPCAQDGPATGLRARTVRPQPRDGPRGRPGPTARPAPRVAQRAAAVAAARAARPARIAPHRCVILATNALATAPRPPPAGWAGDHGQGRVARGCRWLQDPQWVASSRFLQTPARLMALGLVMTLGLWVYAAVDYRSRQARKAHAATVPDHQGKRRHHPPARGVWHGCVGMPWRCQAGQGPMVLQLTAAHQPWRRRRGPPSRWCDDVQ